MSQLLGEEAFAFLLGYESVREPQVSQDPRDVEFVKLLRARTSSGFRDVSVRWSEGGAESVEFVDAHGNRGALSQASLVTFAQGILSASLTLEVDEGDNPAVRLPDHCGEEMIGALATVGAVGTGEPLRVGAAALDLLGRIVEGAATVAPSFQESFDDWRRRVALVQGRLQANQSMRVQLIREGAVPPSKEHVSDSGYDLRLLYESKRVGRTVLYGTGIVIEPPFGWYFDVVPRSSIIKRGYILANSVGVIDRSYRGEIFVPLIKIEPEAPEIELPARVVQLIPRPIVHFPVEQVQSLTKTQRGAGGFGSTGT